MIGISLRWKKLGVGSANLLLGCGGDSVEIQTTYVGDGLGSVLQAAVDLQLGSKSTLAFLPSEPGGTLLFFGGADVDVYLQVVHFSDMETLEYRWSGGQLRWHGRVQVDRFVQEARLMGEDVLRQYGGVDRYVEAWGGSAFPLAQLDALRGR